MYKKVIVLFFFMLIFTSSIYASFDSYNLGSFNKDKLEEEFHYEVDISEKDLNSLMIWIADDNKQGLGLKVAIVGKTEYKPLGSYHEPVQLDISNYSEDILNLGFIIEINAKTNPGIYQDLIEIELYSEDNQSNIKNYQSLYLDIDKERKHRLILNYRVDPTIIIENKMEGTLELEYSGDNSKVISNYRRKGHLLINANTSWELTCELIWRDEITVGDSVKIKVINHNNLVFSDNEMLLLPEQEIKIAQGIAGNEIDIYYLLQIDDYTRISTGNYNFLLQFRVNIIE